MRNNISLAVSAGALLLIGGGCFGGGTSVNVNIGQEQPIPTEKGEPSPILRTDIDTTLEAEKQPEAAPAVETFSITARQWTFSPAEIRVKMGDRVKLTITSVDVDHGFSLPDFNVRAMLKPNTMATVEFTANKKGTFRFFCDVFCGSGHEAMNGQLIVE